MVNMNSRTRTAAAYCLAFAVVASGCASWNGPSVSCPDSICEGAIPRPNGTYLNQWLCLQASEEFGEGHLRGEEAGHIYDNYQYKSDPRNFTTSPAPQLGIPQTPGVEGSLGYPSRPAYPSVPGYSNGPGFPSFSGLPFSLPNFGL